MTTRPLDHRRPSTGSGASDVARAPAGGTPQRVGGFRFYFADDRWEWSEPVQPMHGYEPGTVAPTTEPVVSHKHPKDYDQIAATIEKIPRTDKPLSTRHRIIDAKGQPT
jgi:PAS fold